MDQKPVRGVELVSGEVVSGAERRTQGLCSEGNNQQMRQTRQTRKTQTVGRRNEQSGRGVRLRAKAIGEQISESTGGKACSVSGHSAGLNGRCNGTPNGTAEGEGKWTGRRARASRRERNVRSVL